MNTKLDISLCMIVKNEAVLIRDAITSVLPIVSEVIVVDTGSSDGTQQTATELGATVIETPWNDDFAEPRNLGIDRATCSWVLVLDADERVAHRDLPRFADLVTNSQVCWELTQRHYSDDPRVSDFMPMRGEFPEFENCALGYFESSCVRLFPRLPAIRFRGRIHELVEHSIRERPELQIRRSGILLHHLGHTTAVKTRKKKGNLYTPLGQKKALEQADDFQAWFELGVEHNNNGRLQESFNAFSESLRRNPAYVSSWTNRGYVLCELGRFTEAEADLREAIRRDPKNSEAFGNLGLVYIRAALAVASDTEKSAKLMGQAEQFLKQAIVLSPHYLTALSNLGLVYSRQKRFLEAAVVYQNILAQSPRHAPALADLGGVFLGGGNVVEGERYLRAALAVNGQLHYAVVNLVNLLVSQGRKAEAHAIFRVAIAPYSPSEPLPPLLKQLSEYLQNVSH